MARPRFFVGTSGWVYPGWRRRFYPDHLPEAEWLAHYARHFRSVEINRTFYRLPTRRSFAVWRKSTPHDFVFSVEPSRSIYDLDGSTSPRELTTDFAYLRLHGPRRPHAGRYDKRALTGWAEWLLEQKVKSAHVYFDDDEAAHAIGDALELQEMLA